MSKAGAVIKQIVKLGIMVGILVFLYQKGLLDFSKVKQVLQNPVVVAIGLFTMFGAAVGAVYRWRLLLEGQGIHLTFAQAFRLTFIGMFFNVALPGAVSGDVVKGYYIVKQQPDGKGKSKAFATLLFDRILGVSALVFVSFLAMVLNIHTMLDTPTLKPFVALIGLLFAGVLLFYAFVLIEWTAAKKLNEVLKKAPMGEILSKLFEAVKTYESSRGIIWKGLFASCLIHCSVIGFFVVLAKSLGGFEVVPVDSFFLLAPLGLLVTAVPVAPAGLGTGHAAFFALFQLLGARGGADLFTAFVTFQISVSLFGGLLYLRENRSLKA